MESTVCWMYPKILHIIMHFCNSIEPDLVESICAHSRRKALKYIMMHLDNAHPHNSRKSTGRLEQFCARRVSRPAYSQDLTPNYFFFGYVKSKLPTHVIRSREDLICEIQRIFETISKIILISIYTL
jgi:hypothetical protein